MKYEIWKRWDYDHPDDPTAWKLVDEKQYSNWAVADIEAQHLREVLAGRVVEVRKVKERV
jgi:hypothetical protein